MLQAPLPPQQRNHQERSMVDYELDQIFSSQFLDQYVSIGVRQRTGECQKRGRREFQGYHHKDQRKMTSILNLSYGK